MDEGTALGDFEETKKGRRIKENLWIVVHCKSIQESDV